ncbi:MULTISPECIES: DNA gyrase subunit A [Peptoniphilus]|uniref:DNA gyrase subunit A n=2 Tax=Peptoniphilaceae TaxID=1570339 RepID=UPI0002887FD9|nr:MULTISPECIES: DNA gyrase subunit A [Peptoniphilus]MBS6610855.1 DNA gyrase subunit A [Peptoniphilus harei]MDU5274495.1 DNA gyrase subunit A [Peptoniphilus lacydonensis]MDU5377500.1 DNA gyrase subunit A [Peptoniphilus lacydonensis]MDU5436127.1 DNA gyrase subunit A [Peptoniphilus lacydonensis]MDU5594817.1 DNA gyrase subunit A [Peptoniphilus rhinitidis]
MTENNFIESGILDVDINKKMRSSYLDYSMSVIVARALPDVRDGLKPVHRRILYGMQELNLASNGPYRKSARLVGDVMGKYHPHGDSSIYEATVRLAQDFNTRYPLVDGQGNFGNIDGDGAAAMRYTEVRMTKLAEEMLKDINKNTVDFVPNFDENEKEPTILPARFPNLLVNGSSGIAVGMATNMPPHNMNEAIDGIIAYIDNDEISISELNEIIKGPDFPTGAKIMGTEGIKSAYETGRGKITVRAVTEIKSFKNNREKIVITELPYQVNKSSLIMKIADLAKNKVIEGISNITDASNRKGINIIIELKRDANAEVVLNKLYKNTQMQTTFGIINLALVNGKPEILNLKEIIRYYVDHQVEVVTRRTKFDLDKAEKRAHIVEGLFIALDNIDRIIKIVRSSKDDNEAKEKFYKEFKLTEAQSQAILDMRIRRLTGLEREKLEAEYEKLKADIKWYKEILENNDVLMNLIKDELLEIKSKYGDLRRTVISNGNTDIEIEDIIKKEDVVITLTQFGYIKRMSEGTYKPQKRGGRGVSSGNMRDEDFVKELFVTSTHDTILFFTSLGNVFKLKAYEIPQDSRTSRGTAIINLLDLEEGENITSIIPVEGYDPDMNFLMITEKGLIKRTPFKDYKNIRKSGIIAIKLNEDDKLIDVHLTKNDEDVILVTKKGLSIRFNEEQVRKSGRNSIGVKSIDLSDDDIVVSSDLICENKYVLVISENGYGKLTEISKYRPQNRGGKGLLTYKITKKTGDVAAAAVVEKEDDVMIIADSGIIIRILTGDISIQGRNTSGVKLMNLTDAKVVAVANYIGD